MIDWTIRKGIVLVEIHNNYLLCADREARKICTYIKPLNEIGALIWKCIEKQYSIEEIIIKINDEYELPDGYDVEKDINSFIKTLIDNHYLVQD